MNVFHVTNIVLYALFGLTVLLFMPRIVMHFMGCGKAKKFKDAKKDHKYAILIPARNESKVIRGLLDSIKNQEYDQSLLDVYVIVETLDDPTCEICKDYENVHVFCRQHLELKGKGYAMDECLQFIANEQKDVEESERYEAYFIMDADNILAKDYIKEMNKVYDAGYEVGTSFRGIKNFNDSWVSSSSGLYFTLISTLKNKPKAKLGLGVQITGTGYYISSKIINQLDGWKFNSLTEDCEFTFCSILNNYSNSYNDNARFYDEQPTKLSVSWKQRVRWCKGFMQAGKAYHKPMIKSMKNCKGRKRYDLFENVTSVIPLAVFVITVLYYSITNLVLFIIGLSTGNPLWYWPFIAFLGILIGTYVLLALYTAFIIFVDRKRIKFTAKSVVVTCLMNPFFMLMYLPIFIQALFTKNVEWVPIAHGSNMELEEMEKEIA